MQDFTFRLPLFPTILQRLELEHMKITVFLYTFFFTIFSLQTGQLFPAGNYCFVDLYLPSNNH